MSTKHTPGLVETGKMTDYQYIRYLEQQLMACSGRCDTLLAALRAVSDKSRIEPGYTSPSALVLKLGSIGSMARAAIAKVEGQS